MTTQTLSRRDVLMRVAALTALAVPSAGALSIAAGRPALTVHKDPYCGCCGGWVEHLRAAGFEVTVRETSDLQPLKARLGVPDTLASCHTAEMDGYVIEGHVPVRAIERLLGERPKARGLAVPGMPAGSPGMGGAPEIYEVILFGAGGQERYGRFRGDREV